MARVNSTPEVPLRSSMVRVSQCNSWPAMVRLIDNSAVVGCGLDIITQETGHRFLGFTDDICRILICVVKKLFQAGHGFDKTVDIICRAGGLLEESQNVAILSLEGKFVFDVAFELEIVNVGDIIVLLFIPGDESFNVLEFTHRALQTIGFAL